MSEITQPKPQSKIAYVLSFPREMRPEEIVERGMADGLTLNVRQVNQTRSCRELLEVAALDAFLQRIRAENAASAGGGAAGGGGAGGAAANPRKHVRARRGKAATAATEMPATTAAGPAGERELRRIVMQIGLPRAEAVIAEVRARMMTLVD